MKPKIVGTVKCRVCGKSHNLIERVVAGQEGVFYQCDEKKFIYKYEKGVHYPLLAKCFACEHSWRWKGEVLIACMSCGRYTVSAVVSEKGG